MKFYIVKVNGRKYAIAASGRFAATKKGLILWNKEVRTALPRDNLYCSMNVSIDVERTTKEEVYDSKNIL